MWVLFAHLALATCPDVSPRLPRTPFVAAKKVAHADMFRPLDNPAVIPLAESGYPDDAPAMSIEIAGHVRVYPVDGIAWHHVVNDTIGDEAFAVTF